MPRLAGDAREEIQSAALELFATNGYAQTSLREVAERLGISKAALYYHYRSKDDLLRALMEPLVRDGEELLGEVRSGRLAEPRAVVERYWDLCVTHRALFQGLLSNLQLLTRLDVVEQLITWRSELDVILVGPRPEDRVRAVIALGGLQDCALLFPDEYAGDALRSAAVDAALRALLAPA